MQAEKSHPYCQPARLCGKAGAKVLGWGQKASYYRNFKVSVVETE
jgi:hypothetical protein